MEFNISDLLDDLQDDTVPLQPLNVASTAHIRELTMEKIHTENKKLRRGLGTLGRVVLVAAVMIALATTALAASGFRFSDWISRASGKDFDSDVLEGYHDTAWKVGARKIGTTVESASPNGAVLVISDNGWGYDSAVTTDGKYWLEQWDGEEYVPMEPLTTEFSWPEEVITIPADGTEVNLTLNWEALYGTLSSGYYRIGKTFSQDRGSRGMAEVTGYAKFRLYTEEMTAVLEQCHAALVALLYGERFHLTYTWWVPEDFERDYTSLTNEFWKNGEDYLMEVTYFQETEAGKELMGCEGRMIRDGIGYILGWEGDDASTPVSSWERTDIKENWFYLSALIGWTDDAVSEIRTDGNQITLISQNAIDALYPYSEHVLTFDEAGNLLRVELNDLPSLNCETSEKVPLARLEALETGVDEIAGTIASQDVQTPGVFSWAEEQAANPDARQEGFVNTTPGTADSVVDAIEAAKKECTMPDDPDSSLDCTIAVSFDADAKMWRVKFTNRWYDAVYQVVYLDSEGITQMIVDRT